MTELDGRDVFEVVPTAMSIRAGGSRGTGAPDYLIGNTSARAVAFCLSAAPRRPAWSGLR